MYWFLDFESYKTAVDKYVVKEISILANDGTQCYTYMVKSPKNYQFPKIDKTTIHQYNRHRIPWNYGDYTFNEAIDDIGSKVGRNTVYVKGLEKQRFLESYLVHVYDLDFVPSIKKLNSCLGNCCEIKHGKQCARRKVYELKTYIDNNKLALSE